MTISALGWRPFGTRTDLDIDVAGGPRNAVVTQLVAACRADDGIDERTRAGQAASLTLAGRIGALAAIVMRTAERSELTVSVRCTRADCREHLEIELPLEWVVQQADRAEGGRRIDVVLADGAVVQLSRPTGEHQRRWSERHYTTEAQAERVVLASLLDEDDDRVLAQIGVVGAQLDDADPLPAFRARSVCPACGHADDYAIDLEAALLGELRRQQAALLLDVHRLARQYGWTEAVVAELPRWRRRTYLALSSRDTAGRWVEP